MPEERLDALPVGLSEAEKDDLEKMIAEFRRQRRLDSDADAGATLQAQLDIITQRLADLTEMLLNIDGRMITLLEVIRLSHQKSELLSQRLDTVITAFKKGHAI
ncbi:MAG: hypothetical protein PVH26_07375 [Desulfosarcina sp.]|jgi:hypothetical protein